MTPGRGPAEAGGAFVAQPVLPAAARALGRVVHLFRAWRRVRHQAAWVPRLRRGPHPPFGHLLPRAGEGGGALANAPGRHHGTMRVAIEKGATRALFHCRPAFPAPPGPVTGSRYIHA